MEERWQNILQGSLQILKAPIVHLPPKTQYTWVSITQMSLKTCYSFKAAAIFYWMSSTPRRGDNLGRISWNRDWCLSEISPSESDVHKSIVNSDFFFHTYCLQAKLPVNLTHVSVRKKSSFIKLLALLANPLMFLMHSLIKKAVIWLSTEMPTI
jgi:hypothetical protein